jgi:hypothetical protein
MNIAERQSSSDRDDSHRPGLNNRSETLKVRTSEYEQEDPYRLPKWYHKTRSEAQNVLTKTLAEMAGEEY